MDLETRTKIEATTVKLCDWINRTVDGSASSEELAVLPEVVKATSELIKASEYLY